MDHTAWEERDLPQHMLCTSPQSQELELQPAMELQKDITPISKLCDTLTDTLLRDPVEICSQNVAPMFVDTPQKPSQQMFGKISFLSHLNNSLQPSFHTPKHTPCCSSQETPVQTPREIVLPASTVTPVQFAAQSPLCTPLDVSFDLRNVNSTPRRNPRRSCIDRSFVLGNEQSSIEIKKSILLKNDCFKNHSSSKILSIESKNDVSSDSDISMKSMRVPPDLQEKTDDISQSIHSRKNLFASGQGSSSESEVLKSVPSSFQSNKLLKASIVSEPRLSRKSNSGGVSARRLSFSAKKINKRKSIIPEYDPDNDIFAHGLMPVQFNVDSLKHDIGKFLNMSDTSPNLKRSKSCDTVGGTNNSEVVTQTQCVSSIPRRKPSKQSTQQTSKSTLTRTSSAPNLLMMESSASKSDIKPASEGKIRAFLRARDIIKNIKQRAKNICNVPTSSVKVTLETKSTTVNSKAAVETDNKKVDQSFDTEYNCSASDVHLPPTQPFESFILGDVTAYVEVISNNEDISGGIRKELMKLGATVVPNFTKDVPVTHVVFNDGHISTYKKAKKRNIPLVSVLWIEECRKAGVKVHESLFPPYQIERYESPSIVKQLKRRKIMHFHSGERQRPSPRQKKDIAKNGSVFPSDEHLIKDIPKRNSSRVPKWVDEVAGGNGMMRILVNMTGISRNEFQNLVNRPPTPDSDIEPDQNSPLAVRLLRKMAKNLPADNNINCDSISKNDSSRNDNIPVQNSFSKKLKEASESQNEEVHVGKVKSTKEINKSISANGNNVSSVDSPDSSNITHRKIIPKRKLLSPVEETVTVTPDGDLESIAIENPHNCTPKRLSRENQTKKRKSDNSQGTTAITVSEMASSAQAAGKLNECDPSSIDPIRRSRRSSSYFVKKKKNSPSDVQKPALVCTLLQTAEVDVIVSIADKLGTFIVDKEVTSSTTHIVAGSPKRTMKLLKGLARGCWIVALEWALKSLEAGKWLDEEEFEMTVFSPAVQKYRLEKLSFGRMFQPDIFSTCGPIFVSSHSSAPRGDLVELVLLCGGKIASRLGKAEIAVGKHHTGVVSVTALWILDSVQFYCCRPFDSYLCT